MLLYCPAAHASHEVVDEAEYIPFAHAEHLTPAEETIVPSAPATTDPAAQTSQVTEVATL
jgi:hypothetical protein